MARKTSKKKGKKSRLKGTPKVQRGGSTIEVSSGAMVTTLADGVGSPRGVAVDAGGNLIVADAVNPRILKVTPAGVVSTFAGNGTAAFADGTGTGASFSNPSGVALDVSGNVIVADLVNNRIRKVTPGGVVTTLAGNGTAAFADGTGTGASFNRPSGVAVDAGGNVYVADRDNHRIRKVTPGGVVSTLAGSGSYGSADGTGAGASFSNPSGVAVDSSGNVFVADRTNHRIRKITPSGVVTTLAGMNLGTFADGTGASAAFCFPNDVALDANGNVYVADTWNNRIRKVTPGGVVTTIAGDGYTIGRGVGRWVDGPSLSASFNGPVGVAVDAAGNVFVADASNKRIRVIKGSAAQAPSAQASAAQAPSTSAAQASSAQAAQASAAQASAAQASAAQASAAQASAAQASAAQASAAQASSAQAAQASAAQASAAQASAAQASAAQAAQASAAQASAAQASAAQASAAQASAAQASAAQASAAQAAQASAAQAAQASAAQASAAQASTAPSSAAQASQAAAASVCVPSLTANAALPPCKDFTQIRPGDATPACGQRVSVFGKPNFVEYNFSIPIGTYNTIEEIRRIPGNNGYTIHGGDGNVSFVFPRDCTMKLTINNGPNFTGPVTFVYRKTCPNSIFSGSCDQNAWDTRWTFAESIKLEYDMNPEASAAEASAGEASAAQVGQASAAQVGQASAAQVGQASAAQVAQADISIEPSIKEAAAPEYGKAAQIDYREGMEEEGEAEEHLGEAAEEGEAEEHLGEAAEEGEAEEQLGEAEEEEGGEQLEKKEYTNTNNITSNNSEQTGGKRKRKFRTKKNKRISVAKAHASRSGRSMNKKHKRTRKARSKKRRRSSRRKKL